MNRILLLLLIVIYSTAFAEEPVASNRLQSLLVKNREDVKRGTNDVNTLLLSVKNIADGGDPVAQFIYGASMAETNKQESIKYLNLSSDKGCAGATSMLGVVYMVHKEYDKGVDSFKYAAMNGDAVAQAAFAGFYMRGEHGFPKDIAMAWAWSRLAERQLFSMGSLDVLRKYMHEIKSAGTADEIKKGDQIYADLSKNYPKKAYYMCGQMNVDTSREPEVANLLSPIIK